jgi:ArsR family transcriptional regulator, arsenate/arsenite/antimonite-responsive transcriptional repressor
VATAGASSQAAALAAVAQGTRLRILERLAAAGSGGSPAGEIARSLRCPASTLSFHLKELSRTGIVEARPSGRQVLYVLRRQVLRSIAWYLASLASETGPLPRRKRVAGHGLKRGRAASVDQIPMFPD